MTRKLHAKAGKSALHPEIAVQALGYSGLNGAALGILAALKQYGLLDSQRGTSVAVSPLAIKLIHPMSEQQEIETRKAAALSPKIFNELYTTGHSACAVDVLANHLVQSGFTPEGARKAASIFKENEEFAKLRGASINESLNSVDAILNPEKVGSPRLEKRNLDFSIETRGVDTRQKIRDYRFALDDDAEVELRFFGDKLGADQVQGLIDYLEVMKKRLAREGAIIPPSEAPSEE